MNALNTKPIGEIKHINRYPIKSFAGESLNSVRVESYGLHGDRSLAFVDSTKDGWARYITARQIPEMLSYKAELIPTDQLYPQVKIICPDGRVQEWNDQLLEKIQRFTDRHVTMEQIGLQSLEQRAVDDGSLLIITEQSLKKIEQLWGKKMDYSRFRSNFVISLYGDENDSDYIGRNLIVGDAELTIKSLCERCSMITIDPVTLEKDASLLKKVHESMSLNFGLYADVASVGTVKVGDPVYLA